MLMGSIASGEDGGGAGDLKGTTAPSLLNGDGAAGRVAATTRPIIQICAAPLHTTFVRQCLFFCAQLPQLAPLDALGCRRTLRIREHRHAFADSGGVSRDSGFRPEGRSTRHPGTGSALPIRARLIRRSGHFRPPYSCPARVRCAASKRVRIPSLCGNEAAV